MRIGSGSVLHAIDKRWTAMKLDTVFTGGLHIGTAPKGDKVPYCVLNVVSEVVEGRTSSGDYRTEYTRLMLDFVVFHKTGLRACADAADFIRLKFDNVNLVLQTGEGSILEFRWVNSTPVQHPDITSVWSYTVTYDVLRQREELIN